MDLSFLDKSSGVTPILVRLYDSHRLYDLAKDKKPLARAELTSAVTDLLGMDLSPRESELVADVVIALLRQAETDLRQAIAERLSIMDDVPLRLILKMANDEIDVAGCVLKNSPVLGPLDLIYIIKSKGPEHWRAIALREQMSNQVMNLLADTRDFGTALALVENTKIRLTDHTLGVLSDLAQKNEILAQPLLRRDEVSPQMAATLYEYVGQELKEYIRAHYELDKETVMAALDDVVLEMVDTTANNETLPNLSMLKAADRFKEKGLLTIALMLGTLKRGQIQSFVAQFSRFTKLEPITIAEILSQPSGQGLAVTCRAFGIQKPDFISIFLLTSRIRENEKVADPKDIARAVHYFDNIRPDVAENILRNSISKDDQKH
jgi:uncharacterized protein (DUF2336 family)